jgi:hypothetical protein
MMKGATGYENEGSLKNPVNQVVAVLPHDIDAKVIVRALHAAGVSSDSIGLLVGRRDAHKLDAASGKHGWLGKLARVGPDLGDLDAHHLRNYLKALEEDRTVIAVVGEAGNKRREIAGLLKGYGAAYINSYGMFSIEGLA